MVEHPQNPIAFFRRYLCEAVHILNVTPSTVKAILKTSGANQLEQPLQKPPLANRPPKKVPGLTTPSKLISLSLEWGFDSTTGSTFINFSQTSYLSG